MSEFYKVEHYQIEVVMIVIAVASVVIGAVIGYVGVVQEMTNCVDYDVAMTVADCLKVNGW